MIRPGHGGDYDKARIYCAVADWNFAVESVQKSEQGGLQSRLDYNGPNLRDDVLVRTYLAEKSRHWRICAGREEPGNILAVYQYILLCDGT